MKITKRIAKEVHNEKVKSFDEGIEYKTKQFITNFKEKFNGSITTEEDIYKFVYRLMRCSDCSTEYYDKRCPKCCKLYAEVTLENTK